jgi:hypothetical protein
MKSSRRLFILLTAGLLAASPLLAQSSPARVASTGGRSPHETTSTVIGEQRTGNRVTITYGRPYLKDPKTGEARKIWGGLVPWEKANRLGADEATLLLTQKPLIFGSTTIPAGAHTLYIVPSETGPSKLAFSSNLGKWGVPVDETKDIARIDLAKTTLDQPVDQLTITVEKDAASGGGVINIKWEGTQFSAPFTVAK